MFYLCLPGSKAKPHYHKGIETIAYMLKGECTVFHGKKLAKQTLVKQGEQIFIPDDVPHAPCNLSEEECVWIVVRSAGDDQDVVFCLDSRTETMVQLILV